MSNPSYQSDRIAVELQYATELIAQELASIRESISTRPDRIGDKCWYEFRTCDFINGSSHWSSRWQRGVLRCWHHSSSNCIAMVEDCETHDIIATANLCFAAEDPNKPAKKPQD